jgi:hypothetical protein
MKACPERTFALVHVMSLVLVTALSAVGASDAVAVGNGSEDSPYEIPEITSRVRVDGVLDEDAWSEALELEFGYETSPGENVEPKAKTVVLLASSRTHLYVAFRAYDPDPSAICANITDRDNMFDDDRLSFILDTFNDQRRGYMFFVNPFGIQGDALDVYGMGGGDPAWDTIWDSEGRITDEGYVVECAVPFSSLRFQGSEGKQVWGIGFGRKYSRDFDYRMALTPRDRDETCYLCQIAKFRGFAGATPGRNIELDPTVSTSTTWRRRGFPDGGFDNGRTENDPGLTARWGVTPNLVISGTANPDFSQVEADAFQLEANTQFTLFYEEKRPFFLEGMEHFQMMLDPVYTRTIADPRWGLKMTGKEGSNALGAFVVQDEVTNFIVPGSQSSWAASLDQRVTDAALRYRMDLASASTAGFVVTARDGDGYSNLVGGVDGNLRLSPSDRLEVQVLGSRTDYPDDFAEGAGLETEEFDGMAYDAEINHDSANFDWWVAYRQIDDGFRADMGFRPQTDYRQTRGGWSYAWRQEAGHWYTSINSGFGYVHNEELDGDVLDSFLDYWLNYAGALRSEVNVYGIVGRSMYGDVEYDANRIWLGTSIWPSGYTRLSLDTTYGDAVDYANGRAATRLNLEPTVFLKLARRLDIAAAHEFERLEVDEGRLYTANVSYLRVAYQFTRRTFLRAILQYEGYDFDTDLYSDNRDSRYSGFASQVLFSYKLNPQTVLYLGYSDRHEGADEFDLTQRERTFFAKIGYAWVL